MRNTQRILGYVKRESQNYARRRKSQQHSGEVDDTSAPSIPSKGPTNAYREFQTSQHPSKPKMKQGDGTPKRDAMRQWNGELKTAFDGLPEEDVNAFRAQAAAKRAQDQTREGKEVRRARYVSGLVSSAMGHLCGTRYARDLPEASQNKMHTWQKEAGWVGCLMLGGIDEHGEVACVMYGP